jgi:hypothetical protein
VLAGLAELATVSLLVTLTPEFEPEPDVVLPLLESFADTIPPLIELASEEVGVEVGVAVAVITTGIQKNSVPVNVSVVVPGKLACRPPKDSLQMAVEVVRVQLNFAVL